VTLYEQLIDSDRDLGLRHFGMRALMSLRLEKGYGAFFREFRPDYTPAESGLDRFIAYDKASFIGKAAALEDRATKPAQKFVTLVADTNVEVVRNHSQRRPRRRSGHVRR
jgi:dimethylglycine dehydrogenase